MKTLKDLIRESPTFETEPLREWFIENMPHMTEWMRQELTTIMQREADALAALEKKHGPVATDEAKVKARLEQIAILES